jgi:hypothetical protein
MQMFIVDTTDTTTPSSYSIDEFSLIEIRPDGTIWSDERLLGELQFMKPGMSPRIRLCGMEFPEAKLCFKS